MHEPTSGLCFPTRRDDLLDVSGQGRNNFCGLCATQCSMRATQDAPRLSWLPLRHFDFPSRVRLRVWDIHTFTCRWAEINPHWTMSRRDVTLDGRYKTEMMVSDWLGAWFLIAPLLTGENCDASQFFSPVRLSSSSRIPCHR